MRAGCFVRATTTRNVLIVVIAAATLCGCETLREEFGIGPERWTEAGPYDRPLDEIWEALKVHLESFGFSRLDREGREMTTHWRRGISRAKITLERRTRLHARLQPVGSGWLVEVLSEQEQARVPEEPEELLHPDSWDWVEAGRDAEMEISIVIALDRALRDEDEERYQRTLERLRRESQNEQDDHSQPSPKGQAP